MRDHASIERTPAAYKRRFRLSYDPSQYQAALWAECEKKGDERKPFVVRAVAGAGKTTSLVWAAHLAVDPGAEWQDVFACVFASENAEDMSGKMNAEGVEGVNVSTVHSHGNGALYKAVGEAKQLDENGAKYRAMVDRAHAGLMQGELYGSPAPDAAVETLKTQPSSWPRREILSLIKFARLDLIDFDLPPGDFAGEIDAIAAKHGMDWEPEYDGVIHEIVRRSMMQSYEDAERVLKTMGLIGACSSLRSRHERTVEKYAQAVVRNAGDKWGPEHGAAVRLIVEYRSPAAAAKAFRAGKSSRLIYDFVDMIWLPVVLNLRPRLYSTILLDECQDASRVTLELLDMSLRTRSRNGSRLIFVGDPKQAIYGFAGADTESFDRIVDYCDGRVLPLSVCYRCGSEIIKYIQETCYAPGTPVEEMIQAAPGAPRGQVEPNYKASKFLADVKAGDMVLSRRTAPLIKTLFALVAEGRSATIKGRNVADVLVGSAKRVAERAKKTRRGFLDTLREWTDTKIDKMLEAADDPEDVAEAASIIEDRAECVRIIWTRVAERDGRADLASFIAEAESIFSDTVSAIVLSTVHRAKGLEADRVFIIEPQRLENPFANSMEQAKQERNLRYVAFSRARLLLALVRDGQRDAQETEDDEID